MSYKVLYRKYRPSDFDNVVGQEYTISMLKNAIINGKTSHAYLFTGPRGTGKTSTAKIFAKALNCEHHEDGNPCNKCDSCLNFNESPDVIELDAASNNSVEDIREIINNVKLVPTSMKYKIYIIDEVHMLSQGAFNALLLTLEEPPEHVIFILATTEIQKVPITILSRCQRFDFKPVNLKSMVERLKFISKEEHIAIDDDAIEEISLISAGGMRDAIGMLDQFSSISDTITLEMVSSNFGSVSSKHIKEIINCIDKNDTESLLKMLEDIRNMGTNYTIFIEKLISELRKSAVAIKTGKYNYNMTYEDIYNMIFDLNEMLLNMSLNINPYVLIEIVLLKYISAPNNNLSTSTTSSNYFPGNNLKTYLETDVTKNVENKDIVKYFPGNNMDNSSSNVSVLGNNSNDLGNNPGSMGNNLEKTGNISDNLGNNLNNSNCISIDINIRINNCFVEASKDVKKEISSSWVDFLNFLMNKDRSMVSMLADTSILAASNRYILIQSKNESTNTLINQDINKLEKLYSDFSNKDYRFSAVNNDLWKKEVEKYRINMKNKIQYTYIEEEGLSTNDDSLDDNNSLSDIEKLAGEIFDSYEVVE